MAARMKALIAYDGSTCAEAALDDLKRAGLPGEVEAMVGTVAELWLPPPSTMFEPILTGATEPLSAIKVEEPKRLLLSEAERWDADCIFVGARGLSRLKRVLLGSVSMAVVARAHCSVEVVRAK